MVGHTLGICAGAVTVVVVVYVVDEVIGAPVEVGNLAQGRSRVGLEPTGRGVGRAGQQDPLRCGASLTDSGDGGLSTLGPLIDVKVVWLVHDAEDDVGGGCVVGRELRPEVGKVIVGWATLADNLAVPASVVVL